MASMSKHATRPTDPLAETEWLLVDGTNLLFAMSRAPGAAPGSALIGRLRGAVPPSVAIDVVFDGPGERGLRNERIASGLRVRYSGPRTADAVLLSLVDETRAVDGPAATASILVVTNDRELKASLHARGARTAGADWLLGRLDRVGSGRPPTGVKAKSSKPSKPPTKPRPVAPEPSEDDDPDAGRWEPGRGATVKKGNPRKAPRSAGRD
jgi:YacP-like NYN domain